MGRGWIGPPGGERIVAGSQAGKSYICEHESGWWFGLRWAHWIKKMQVAMGCVSRQNHWDY